MSSEESLKKFLLAHMSHNSANLDIKYLFNCQMTVKMILNYPKVCVCKDKTVYVYFYLNDKRYRLYNGNKIGKKIFPNSYPINQRRGIAEQLAQEIYLHLINNDYCFKKELLKNELELFDLLLDKKLKEHLSDKYKSTISSIDPT